MKGEISVKKIISVVLLLCLSVFVVGVFTVYGDVSDKDKCLKFLADYGWETEGEVTDFADVTVPQSFDLVYESYNAMQLKSGLDLLPYRGKSGKRYTFIVTNYPVDVGETIYANVIVIDGKPVGGDIMTVSLSGFMHGLDENNVIN